MHNDAHIGASKGTYTADADVDVGSFVGELERVDSVEVTSNRVELGESMVGSNVGPTVGSIVGIAVGPFVSNRQLTNTIQNIHCQYCMKSQKVQAFHTTTRLRKSTGPQSHYVHF